MWNRCCKSSTIVICLAISAAAQSVQAQSEWKADASKAAIPQRPAVGKVAGELFKVDKAEIQFSPASPGKPGSHPGAILTLRQGKEFFADRSFVVFLALKPGSKLDGLILQVPPLQFGPGSFERQPHFIVNGNAMPILQGIHMSHRKPGKPLPDTDMFQDRYSMHLQLGKANGDKIPGQIYVSVPDKAKSYVAGTFTATLK
jgi:hypothetical protein